jgi:hypothetical protein
MAKSKAPKPEKAKPGKDAKAAAKAAGKGKKGGGQGKGSKIPRPVQSRAISTAGLLALVPIALLLLHGTLDLEAAAKRAALVLVGLMAIERLVAPVVLAVLNSSRTAPSDTSGVNSDETPEAADSPA